MTSPARRHFQRVTAARAAGDAVPGQPQNGEQYELMMAAMWEARRSLKAIKSTEGKIALKRQLLPQFDAYIEGVLESGSGAQDDVLARVMIWRFDIGDLPGALSIARYAVEHDLDTPDSFERDTPSLVAEQLAEETLGQLDRSTDEDRLALATTLAGLCSEARGLIDGADMHDQISAKFHKAYGYALRDAGCPAAALEQLKRAYTLNDRVGVKQDIQKLEREITRQNAGTPGQ
ncbi:phage terminase small subunit [Salinicola avicenniae]|uniref:phage terminase small subunit n=1 Tax=Salinicola avicenniae TaxID=2916836 RepID=UPI0020731EF4|nr:MULTISPECIES: phage terminase small subunit [unclassified Salinicola]